MRWFEFRHLPRRRRAGPSPLAIAALASVASLAVSAALAQDSVHRSAQAASGQPVRLSVHLNLKRDCSPDTPPEVRVVTAPQNGSLAIRSGKLRAARIQSCENVEVPAQAVLYQ